MQMTDITGRGGAEKALVDIAVREVDRLDRLISDLLDYARPRTEERQPLDLGEVVGEIGKALDTSGQVAEVAAGAALLTGFFALEAWSASQDGDDDCYDSDNSRHHRHHGHNHHGHHHDKPPPTSQPSRR